MHPDSPISATLVCWGNAWLAGQTGLDQAADRVERQAGPQLVATPGGDVPLRIVLADLRGDGLAALRLALPAAGDPLGLTGPAPFTSAAVDAGQAVTAVLPGRCLGLVPAPDRRGSSYSGVRWSVFEASTAVPDVPSLAEPSRPSPWRCARPPTPCSAWSGPPGHRRTPRPRTTGLAPGVLPPAPTGSRLWPPASPRRSASPTTAVSPRVRSPPAARPCATSTTRYGALAWPPTTPSPNSSDEADTGGHGWTRMDAGGRPR
ncbi:hypothetical protein [Planomonospora algeriensis]